MARFLHGMNKEIQHIVKLYYYTSLDAIVHQATQVKCQQRRSLTSKRSYPNSSNSWKGKERDRERPRNDKSPKEGSVPTHVLGEMTNCLPMPQQEEHGYEGRWKGKSENYHEKSSSSSEVESSSDSSNHYGDLFMVRRLMNA
ncbi:hypothetical protein CR513_19116, partial [Mucuna pruriens]